MTDDARALAEAEHEAWAETPEGMRALVRLQYLGANLEPVLAPLRTRNAHYVERILSVPPAPEPRYPPARQVPDTFAPRRRERMPQSLLGVEASSRRRWAADQARVARWMEGQEPFSPEVMGWPRDDPRAEGWEDGRYD